MRLFAICASCGGRIGITKLEFTPIGHDHWITMQIEKCQTCMAEYVQSVQAEVERKHRENPF